MKRSEKGGERYEKKEAPVIQIPHDPYNEQVLVAAMMGAGNEEAELLARVPADHFLVEDHQVIWAALLEAHRKQLQPSVPLLVQLSGGKVDSSYVDGLLSRHPSAPPNLKHHVSVLEWDKARGDAVDGPLSELCRALKDPTAGKDRIRALAYAVGVAFDYADKRGRRDPGQLVNEQMDAIGKRRERQACFPYGIDGLDQDEQGEWRLIPGAAPGQITVVTAVPGSGKSTIAANMALGLARQQRRVGIGAWEMGEGITLELLAAISLGLSRRRLTVGDITDEEHAAMGERMAAISAWVQFWPLPRWIPQSGKRRTNEEAIDRVHQLICDGAVDVAIFDLLKKVLPCTDPDDEEHALNRLQAVAEKTKTHLVLVQQQRFKDVELRPNRKPTREGIKGSGAWVEVADTILGVHNPALWTRTDMNTLEIDVLKQRYAPYPLAVEFDFAPDLGRLSGGRTIEYDPPSKAGVVAGAKGSKGDDTLSKFLKTGSSGNGRARARSGASGEGSAE